MRVILHHFYAYMNGLINVTRTKLYKDDKNGFKTPTPRSEWIILLAQPAGKLHSAGCIYPACGCLSVPYIRIANLLLWVLLKLVEGDKNFGD